MKILHAGNMVNLGYVITRQLRNDGVDAELLMEKNPHQGSDPVNFDPALKGRYPNWITFYDKRKWTWKIDIIKKMRKKKYDLIHAYVELPIFAYLSRRPFVVFTQGSDFRELAFTNTIRGRLLRKAYRRAKIILFSQPDHYPLFSKLKLENGIFLPILWDTTFFQPKIDFKKTKNDKFVIFHPSHLNWRLKGDDILIKAFANFARDNSDVELIMIKHGPDFEKTRSLVHSLGIEKKVNFINPLSSSGMLEYYNFSDVVADQFVLGSMGAIALESFCCATPLITFIHKELHKILYGEIPPIAYAKSVKEISTKLELLKDKRFRVKLGQEGRKWVLKFHSPRIFSKKLQLIYEYILGNQQINDIHSQLKIIN